MARRLRVSEYELSSLADDEEADVTSVLLNADIETIRRVIENKPTGRLSKACAAYRLAQLTDKPEELRMIREMLPFIMEAYTLASERLANLVKDFDSLLDLLCDSHSFSVDCIVVQKMLPQLTTVNKCDAVLDVLNSDNDEMVNIVLAVKLNLLSDTQIEEIGEIAKEAGPRTVVGLHALRRYAGLWKKDHWS